MGAAIGWYGPLIDLSDAPSHIGGFVQLLVFVHRSTPVQYKLSKGGAVIRTDIGVGDETRPFFTISLWQKHMGSLALAGDVILLQNVKITKFADAVEARTVYCSSLLSLVHPYESIVTKDVDDIVDNCEVGAATKDKLRKVIQWVKKARSTFCNVELCFDQKGFLNRNWKVHEEEKLKDFFSLRQISNLMNSCKATFYASIGEIFLPITWRKLGESENENMFISRRIYEIGYTNLAEDLICTGCQLCGSPLDLDYESIYKSNGKPLYCHSSSDRLHKISMIYRPFMLYVWDETDHVPLLVKNKAAELLFGSLRAEKVYSSGHVRFKNPPHARNLVDAKPAEDKAASSYSGITDKSHYHKDHNFYQVWLIVLKMLLQQGKNSPLKFEVNVNTSLDIESGRFEIVSISMPTPK